MSVTLGTLGVAIVLLIGLTVLPAYARTRDGRWRILARLPSVALHRALRAALALAAAFLVFVGLDFVSGGAITGLAGNPTVTAIAVAALVVAIAFDAIVLFRRRPPQSH